MNGMPVDLRSRRMSNKCPRYDVGPGGLAPTHDGADADRADTPYAVTAAAKTQATRQLHSAKPSAAARWR